MTEEGGRDVGRFPMRIDGRLTVVGVEREWSPQATLAARSGGWRLALVGASAGVLGWSAADLAVVPALELLHPDDRDVLVDAAEHRGGRRLPFRPLELRVLARDSRYWWTRWQVGAGPHGSVARGVEYLSPDVEHGPPVGTWHWDADRDIVSWSTEVLDMFDMRVGPPVSYAAFLSFVLDDDREGFARHVDSALAEGRPFVSTFRCSAGEDHDLWFHATGCRSVAGPGRRRLAGLVKYLNPPQGWPVRSSTIGFG